MRVWLGILVVVALASSAGAAQSAGGLVISLDEQVRVDLTVYDDFAVVRDVRETVLPKGILDLEFQGVARAIDPASVSVGAEHGGGLTLLQQSYQYDLLNRQSLLERYVGSKLKYSRSVLQGTTYEKVLREGILLAVNPEIVKFGDEVEISPEGIISLPYVPEGLRTIPTLIWKVDNERTGAQALETSYVTDGMGWTTDYVLELSESEDRFDMVAWVNVSNESGTAYRDANVSLIAGQVNRAVQPKARHDNARLMAAEAAPMRQESFSDYYMYKVPGKVSLANHETRQLRLLDATAVGLEKRYVATGQVANHQMPQPQSTHFDVEMSFVNTQRNHVGRPLPAGRIRAFKPDSSGAMQLLGEDRIGAAPVDERVQFTVGKAFDLVLERTQKSWRRVDERSVEVSYELSLRNRKEEAVMLIVQEKLYGDWKVQAQSAPGDRVDSTTYEFAARVDARTTRTITYSVHMDF